MKYIKKTLGLLTCAFLLTCLSFPTRVSAQDLQKQPLQLFKINTTDVDPLSSLKEQIIEQRAEEGLLDLTSIDMDKSLISVEKFSNDQHGFEIVNASIQLASNNDDTTPLGYSFTEPVLVSLEQSVAPELILTSESVNVKLNDAFDPMAYVAYLNDNTQLPTIEVDNPVDTTTPGYYEVTYTAKNMSGKSTIRKMNVHVIEPLSGPRLISLEECHIADDGSIEAMFEAINAVRTANGLDPYEYGDTLMQKAAAIRAEEASSFIGHYRPDGSYYPSVFTQLGINVSALEILVAYGDSVQTNLNWWLNEPRHCAIVLSPNFTHIVLGHYGSVWSGEAY